MLCIAPPPLPRPAAALPRDSPNSTREHDRSRISLFTVQDFIYSSFLASCSACQMLAFYVHSQHSPLPERANGELEKRRRADRNKFRFPFGEMARRRMQRSRSGRSPHQRRQGHLNAHIIVSPPPRCNTVASNEHSTIT